MDKFICLDDFENSARERLDKPTFDYFRGGATLEKTLQENRSVFSRYRIRPKCLRDVSKLDISAKVLGQTVKLPFGIAPAAMQKLVHPDGEIANAKAAGNLETLFILSTASTTSLEELAETTPSSLKWFQLYIYKDREVSKSLVLRAEKAGYKAIVLTVDAPCFGIRRHDIRNKFTLPPHLKMANFEALASYYKIDKPKSDSGITQKVGQLFDNSLTWKDVEWLKSLTKLPIVVKGILRGDDAQMAAKHGVAGIIVSNHGARQIDGTVTSVDVLPEILDAVKGSGVEVYLDGGIREGTDILKALALGAKMVFIGRPAIWGLAAGGEEGVEKVLNILKLELESAMAISGCSKISDLTRDLLIHESKLSTL